MDNKVYRLYKPDSIPFVGMLMKMDAMPAIFFVVGLSAPFFAWISLKQDTDIDSRIVEISGGNDPALPLIFEWRKMAAFVYFSRGYLIAAGLLMFFSWLFWNISVGPLSLMLAFVVLLNFRLRNKEIVRIISGPAFILDRSGFCFGGDYIRWDAVVSIKYVRFLRSGARIRVVFNKPLPKGCLFVKADRIDLPAVCVHSALDFVGYAHKVSANTSNLEIDNKITHGRNDI